MDTLRIPERILDLIPPTASGYGGGTAEKFEKRTDPTFDPIGAATIAADITITALLQPQRAARTIEQHGRNLAIPGFGEVVTALQGGAGGAPPPTNGGGGGEQGGPAPPRPPAGGGPPPPHGPRRGPPPGPGRGAPRQNLSGGRARTPPPPAPPENIPRFPAPAGDSFKKTDPLPTPAGEPIGGKGGR